MKMQYDVRQLVIAASMCLISLDRRLKKAAFIDAGLYYDATTTDFTLIISRYFHAVI